MIAARSLVLIAALVMVPGCGEGRPTGFDFGIGASNRSPVVVSVMDVDGVQAYPADTVRFNGAEGYPRQQGATSFAGPKNDTFVVRAEWTEILTGRSYLGEAQVRTDDLSVEAGIADLIVLLLPGGTMVIGSDPLPKTTKVETRDIARICAERQPAKDRVMARKSGGRFVAAPGAPTLVGEALGFVKSPLLSPPCQKSE